MPGQCEEKITEAIMPSLRAAPNLTPMIDLMLVLLMIFMIVQLFAPAIALPTSKHSTEPPKPNAVVLRINRQGTFELAIEDELGGDGGWQVTPAALGPELARLYARRPLDRVLYLKADSALAFGVIEAALSRARGAGVRVVAIVTERRTR